MDKIIPKESQWTPYRQDEKSPVRCYKCGGAVSSSYSSSMFACPKCSQEHK